MNKQSFTLLALSLFAFAGQTALSTEGEQSVDLSTALVAQKNIQSTSTSEETEKPAIKKELPKTPISKEELAKTISNLPEVASATLFWAAIKNMFTSTGNGIAAGLNWTKDSGVSVAKSGYNTFFTKEYGASAIAIIVGLGLMKTRAIFNAFMDKNFREAGLTALESTPGAAMIGVGLAYPTYKTLAAGLGYAKATGKWAYNKFASFSKKEDPKK